MTAHLLLYLAAAQVAVGLAMLDSGSVAVPILFASAVVASIGFATIQVLELVARR